MYRSGGSMRIGTVSPTRVLGNFALPLQLSNTMKYVETFTINLAGSTATTWLAANGMFLVSPVLATAHKPMYFNQLALLYNKYHVVSSTLKCNVINTTGTAANSTQTVTVFLDDNNTLLTFNGVQERAQARSTIFNNVNSTQRPSAPVSCAYNAVSTFGTGTLANTSLQGTSTSNPPDQMYYMVTVGDAGVGTTGTIQVRAEILYKVIWTDLKEVDQST